MAYSSSSSFWMLSLVFLLFTVSEAREILVGGSTNSWRVPDQSSNHTLNHWAEANRFKVGDILVFKYDPNIDSVLEVKKEDVESCNTSKPIKQYKDGNTKVELDRSGPHHFISGAPGNCQRGEKVTVVVLSPRTSAPVSPSTDGDVSKAPAPSPASNSGVRRGFFWGSGLLVLMAALALA